jgi:hypothetical protein
MDMLEGHSIFFLKVMDALGRVYLGGTPEGSAHAETPEGSAWAERRGRKWPTEHHLFFLKISEIWEGSAMIRPYG